jgi:hypothetical protein
MSNSFLTKAPLHGYTGEPLAHEPDGESCHERSDRQVRTFTDGVPAPRRRADRSVQLALCEASGRPVPPSNRGHRRQEIDAGVRAGHTRRARMARHGLGRRHRLPVSKAPAPQGTGPRAPEGGKGLPVRMHGRGARAQAEGGEGPGARAEVRQDVQGQGGSGTSSGGRSPYRTANWTTSSSSGPTEYRPTTSPS